MSCQVINVISLPNIIYPSGFNAVQSSHTSLPVRSLPLLHLVDFFFLISDDLLREIPQLRCLPILEIGLRHLGRSLVMRDHDGEF